MKMLMRYGAVTCAIILGACGKDTAGPNVDTPLLTADHLRALVEEHEEQGAQSRRGGHSGLASAQS